MSWHFESEAFRNHFLPISMKLKRQALLALGLLAAEAVRNSKVREALDKLAEKRGDEGSETDGEGQRMVARTWKETGKAGGRLCHEHGSKSCETPVRQETPKSSINGQTLQTDCKTPEEEVRGAAGRWGADTAPVAVARADPSAACITYGARLASATR
jgi:hypothetical protein